MKLGFDLCAVERMRPLLTDSRFLERYFTPEEGAYIRSRGEKAAESLAGAFAAKEALLKALEIGISVDLREIAVRHDPVSGAPFYVFCGKTAEIMKAYVPSLSISHDGGVAGAVCLLEKKEDAS